MGAPEEREEGGMPTLEDEEVETEGVIREYQRNAKPIQNTIKLLEFYWRIGGRMKEQK